MDDDLDGRKSPSQNGSGEDLSTSAGSIGGNPQPVFLSFFASSCDQSGSDRHADSGSSVGESIFSSLGGLKGAGREADSSIPRTQHQSQARTRMIRTPKLAKPEAYARD